MNKLIEKIVKRARECAERYDDVAFTEMNENGQTLDFEYAHGKKDGCNEIITIIHEEAKAYNESVKGDLISRQALIESLKVHFDAYYREDEKMVYSDHICTSEDCDDLIKLVNNQPTVYND